MRGFFLLENMIYLYSWAPWTVTQCEPNHRVYTESKELIIFHVWFRIMDHPLWVLYYLLRGIFRIVYLVYFGFYCLLFSERWLRTSEDRGERQAQISGILLRGMLIEWAFSILCLEEDSNLHALQHEILSLACLPFHHQGILKVNRIPWIWYLSNAIYGIYDKGGVLEYFDRPYRNKYTNLFGQAKKSIQTLS